MNKHALMSLFEELAKECLRSGSSGTDPASSLKQIWDTLKQIREEYEKMPEK